MAYIDTDRLKQIEIEMFKVFKYICEKHELKYFMLGGTALGTIRHKGFIPWDDDIDVGMPREDYNKFIEIAKSELPEGLFLQNIDTDPEYLGAFAKIRNSRTTFIEIPVADFNINHGVFIDVFPLDGCKDYETIVKKSRILKLRINACYKSSKKKSVKRKLMELLAKIKNTDAKKAIGKLNELYCQYPYSGSEIIANYSGAWGKKEVMPKEIFGDGCVGMFEGIEVTLPEKYDEYLTRLYGDYMTPPPPEKRVGHHYCTVIDLDNPYTNYIKGE